MIQPGRLSRSHPSPYIRRSLLFVVTALRGIRTAYSKFSFSVNERICLSGSDMHSRILPCTLILFIAYSMTHARWAYDKRRIQAMLYTVDPCLLSLGLRSIKHPNYISLTCFKCASARLQMCFCKTSNAENLSIALGTVVKTPNQVLQPNGKERYSTIQALFYIDMCTLLIRL